MSPPVAKPIPRFVAEPPHEGLPYGRWAQLLREEFTRACGRIGDLSPGAPPPGTAIWFPERTWAERVFVPVTARGEGDSDEPIEYFGYVSFRRLDDGEPTELEAVADYTDVIAEQNPDWAIDLNDDVIAGWQAEEKRAGSMTLIWGTPLVPGAVAATAELEGQTVDQCAVVEERFTLIALDAIVGFGDDLFLEVKLWNRQNDELAAETLYEDEDEEEEGEAESEEGGGEEASEPPTAEPEQSEQPNR